MGIPAVTTVTELVVIVYFLAPSSVLNSPPWFYLALATVTVIAVFAGAAVKQGNSRYVLASALVGVGALAVIVVVSECHRPISYTIGYTLVGLVMGYITGKPSGPATKPTKTAPGPS